MGPFFCTKTTKNVFEENKFNETFGDCSFSDIKRINVEESHSCV